MKQLVVMILTYLSPTAIFVIFWDTEQGIVDSKCKVCATKLCFFPFELGLPPETDCLKHTTLAMKYANPLFIQHFGIADP